MESHAGVRRAAVRSGQRHVDRFTLSPASAARKREAEQLSGCRPVRHRGPRCTLECGANDHGQWRRCCCRRVRPGQHADDLGRRQPERRDAELHELSPGEHAPGRDRWRWTRHGSTVRKPRSRRRVGRGFVDGAAWGRKRWFGAGDGCALMRRHARTRARGQGTSGQKNRAGVRARGCAGARVRRSVRRACRAPRPGPTAGCPRGSRRCGRSHPRASRPAAMSRGGSGRAAPG